MSSAFVIAGPVIEPSWSMKKILVLRRVVRCQWGLVVLYGALQLPRLVEEGSQAGRAIGELHATLVWVLTT
jgi:hypothetical protein